MVERHLAKVDVASSNLVSRSIFFSFRTFSARKNRRHSQVAKAEDCKSFIPGSNPGAASLILDDLIVPTEIAGVAELVDAADLKSAEASVFVPVRIRPSANFLTASYPQ